MRMVIWLVSLFVVAVVAATAFGTNDGLVSIYWGAWRMDLALNLFVLLVLGFCFSLVTLIQLVNTLTGLPRRAWEWRSSRRDRTAQAALRDALAQYFGGRYSRGERSAQKALAIQAGAPDLAQDKEFTVLAHLLYAGCAHRLQNKELRDQQLAQALALSSQNLSGRTAEEGARLLAAEWALDDRDAPRALSLLAELPSGVARRTHALRLRLQATRLALQPLEALKTARLLAKHQGLSQAAATGLLRSLATEALSEARDIDQLRRAWTQLDPADRRDAFVAASAAVRVTSLGAAGEARAWLRPFWERLGELSMEERASVSEALVASIQGIGPEWLPRLESAAQSFPRDTAIAHAVGSALVERQLWGKAGRLLEQVTADPSAPVSSRRHAWLLLAKLAEEETDASRASECYAKAARVQ